MILEGPINDLSLGNVTLNIARELIRRNELEAFFLPQGVDQAHFAAYDRLSEEVRSELIRLGLEAKTNIKRDSNAVKIWHINGSERRLAAKQNLFTFYECSEPTETEKNLIQLQDRVILTSNESIDNFVNAGIPRNHFRFVPLGFDEDFCHLPFPKPETKIHFGLIGKFEKRKNTEEIISAWLDLYGNNPDYQLTCLINNPFFPENTYKAIIQKVLRGQNWNNVNILPRLETNSQVNQLINAIDVDLSGANGNEGWNLPSFNAACLGKVCLVGYAGAHKDWAKGDNVVTIKPDGVRPCYDDVFFKEGGPFNQGDFHNFSPDTIKNGIQNAAEVFLSKEKWEERKDLQEEFSYKNTVDKLLEAIS